MQQRLSLQLALAAGDYAVAGPVLEEHKAWLAGKLSVGFHVHSFEPFPITFTAHPDRLALSESFIITFIVLPIPGN
jgi:hypothetical protein